MTNLICKAVDYPAPIDLVLPYLLYVYVERPHHTGFVVSLAKLSQTEMSMDNGRFEFFSEITQQYTATLSFESGEVGLMKWFNTRLDWLGENCKNMWSSSVFMNSVHDGDCEFSFENLSDFTLFVLKFK